MLVDELLQEKALEEKNGRFNHIVTGLTAQIETFKAINAKMVSRPASDGEVR